MKLDWADTEAQLRIALVAYLPMEQDSSHHAKRNPPR